MKTAKLIFPVILLMISNGCSKDNGKAETNLKKNYGEVNEDSGRESKDAVSSSGEKSGLKIIRPDEVKFHTGDSLIVRGYIADIYFSEKVAYLNFENSFPKNLFSCVVFENKFREFGDLSVYKNKRAEVRGKITTYKSKSQIILTSKDQIKIIHD